MCNTHTCHKFSKSLNIKLKEFYFQPELLEMPGEANLTSKTKWVWAFWCQRIIRVSGGSSYLMCFRQGQRISIYSTRKLMTCGIKSYKSSHSSPAVFKQGCSIKFMTYSVFLPRKVYHIVPSLSHSQLKI